MLDDLFTSRMFEIDIDIRRLVAIHGQEAVEEQRDVFRVHIGDFEAIADGRIGGGPAPLAEDAGTPRKLHDIAHRQEIGGICLRGDQVQFIGDGRPHFGGMPVVR